MGNPGVNEHTGVCVCVCLCVCRSQLLQENVWILELATHPVPPLLAQA